MGVPSKKDVGLHQINVKAYGISGDIANDLFNVKVILEKHDRVKHKDKKVKIFIININKICIS